LLRFRNPDLAPAEVVPALRVASLDLETTPDASGILSAALVADDFDEVHLVTPGSVPGAHAHRSEADLLRALLVALRRLDPDVLVGWNVVDFDLRVLAARCEALGLPAELGRVPGAIAFHEDRGFTRQSRAGIAGRMVLDGIGLVRDALKLEDYRLETVAQAVLGRGWNQVANFWVGAIPLGFIIGIATLARCLLSTSASSAVRLAVAVWKTRK